MTPVVVAGIWLALGVGVCLLTGRGIERAGRRPGRSARRAADRTAATQPRSFVELSTLDWVQEADHAATAELLSLRPGAIRQVPAR